MALTIAKSDIAHYLHATLERFDAVAVQEISKLFHAAVNTAVEPGLVELSYDERNHVFTLIHHNCFGSQLDEALGRVIRNYIASESAAVTRFAECALGDPFDGDDVETEQSDAPTVDDQALTIHVVNFDGTYTYSKARAFHFRDLPPALRNRVISRHNNEHLAASASLRRVRWDPTTEQHIFDGSIGHQLPKLSNAEHVDLDWLLQLLSFSPFDRKITISAPRNLEPEVKHWEFVGKEPTIGQWLEGMGETRQIDPNIQPEMGGEEFRFARGKSLQNNLTGRIRKPKGVPLTEHQLPESRPLDQPETELSGGFAALMRSDVTGDIYSEADSSGSGSDEVNPFEGFKSVKAIEPAKGDITSTSGKPLAPPTITQGQGQVAPTDAKPATVTPSSRAHLSRSQLLTVTPVSQGTSVSEAGFPNDGRSYAKSDRWGLTGDAANHVVWEKENAASLLSHRVKRAPRTYDELWSERAESVSASASAGRDSRMYPQPVAVVTPMSYNETALGGDEPWASKIVRPSIVVPTGNLINTDLPIADNGQPKTPRVPPGIFPPGLFPPLGSNEPQRPKIVNAINAAHEPLENRRPQHQTVLQTSEIAARKEDALIDFGDDDAPLIEHGKAKDDKAPRLHSTMRQQAGPRNKQQKKKNTKSSTNRPTPSRPAVLELPSPPPPPKPKPSIVVKSDPKVQDTGEPEASLRLEQAISELFPHAFLNDGIAGVEVHFGLALMTDVEVVITDKALKSAEMQEELDELPPQHRNTAFLLVLGSERVDGVYLLRLPTTLSESNSPYAGDARLVDTWEDAGTHGIRDRKLYEINITVPSGREWLIVFDQETPEDVEISLLKDSSSKQSICIHYPQRVWDARIRAQPDRSTTCAELDEDLERNIKIFLQTFDSTCGGGGGKEALDAGLPDFEAIVPDNAFLVTKILAKREMTRTLTVSSNKTPGPPGGISTPAASWVVSQVWDLHVQSSPNRAGGGSNLVVFAKDEKTMRAQGRVWWEASLLYEGAIQDGGRLETLLNEIVARLDAVGMPAVAAPVKVKPDKGKNAKREYVPYW